MNRALAATNRTRRRRSDRLYPRTLGPRELKALRLVEQRPGITVEQLAERMGVTLNRAWQYVGRLEAGRVRLEPEVRR